MLGDRSRGRIANSRSSRRGSSTCRRPITTCRPRRIGRRTPTLDMTVTGYLHADDPGELIIETGETMTDDAGDRWRVVEPPAPSRHQAALDRGRHFMQMKSHLTGNRWALRAAVERLADRLDRLRRRRRTSIPSAFDRRDSRPAVAADPVRSPARSIIGWIATFVRCWRDPVTLGFSLVASLIVGWLGAHPGPTS